MKRILLISLGLTCCLLLSLSCADSKVGPDEDRILLYLNSFETDADTVGWWGTGSMTFQSEAPLGGGRQSIRVSGGCVTPHAVFDLEPSGEDRRLILRCWGKSEGLGGFVALGSLDSNDTRGRVYSKIRESEWAPYRTDTLFWPANEPLTLQMHGGGLFFGAVVVDLLEVRVVE